jgi:glutaredoxin
MIVVWTQAGCGPCYALKRALKGVTFVERDAGDADADRLAEWRSRGWQTPIVEHAGGTFAGFDPAKVRALADARR